MLPFKGPFLLVDRSKYNGLYCFPLTMLVFSGQSCQAYQAAPLLL